MSRSPTAPAAGRRPRLRGLAIGLLWLAALSGALPPAGAAAQDSDESIIIIETDGILTDGQDVLTYPDAVVVSEDGSESPTGPNPFSIVSTDGYAPSRPPIFSVGPFHLISADTVEMIGTIESNTPALFARLLASHAGIRRLVMIECPGSVDETATLRLARAVRRAGIATHVPVDGSVRSGAVDVWLAGVHRTAARNAEFGVHSWRDEEGREARDYAASDPVHAEYLAFYRELGLSDRLAREYYDLTNSVSFDDLLILSRTDMARLGLLDEGR